MSEPAALVAIGEDAILQRIESGESQAEIARSLKIDAGDLSRWLRATDQRSARARDARAASAEAWLDRGLDGLLSATPDAVAVTRARYVAQECARRAGQRNPAYREKVDSTVSGPDGGPQQHVWTVEMVKPATQDTTGSVSVPEKPGFDRT